MQLISRVSEVVRSKKYIFENAEVIFKGQNKKEL